MGLEQQVRFVWFFLLKLFSRKMSCFHANTYKMKCVLAELNVQTPETMTLHTYASMLEASHNRLLKSVFHVDDTSDVLQYMDIAPKNEENVKNNQMPSTTQRYIQPSTSSHRFTESFHSKTSPHHKHPRTSEMTEVTGFDNENDESSDTVQLRTLSPLQSHRLHVPASNNLRVGSRKNPLFWRPTGFHGDNGKRYKRNIVTRGARRRRFGGDTVHSSTTNGDGIVASAYTHRLGASEFADEHHEPPEPGNLYFVVCLFCLLIACVFTVTFMLLPFRSCPKNHHIPVIIWSATILCSVACNVESSVHPRLALGWILLETFLIWITIPLRMRTALFYTTTVALIYVIVMSVRERARPYLGRQVGSFKISF